MDLSTLQKTCENTNLQQQQKNQEKAMEKLRETILKLSNKEPNVPLSQTQNSILQKHLNRFLSGLHSTPFHPPYTWMIEKALQKLDEEGGSSEDSISEFIKKEQHSLPRAHITLLKHHLQKMTEKGEILMIDGRRFLLPGDRESVNPKRKIKMKRKRNSSIKQKKPQQKEKKEEDPRQEVYLEQPTKQHRGRPAKYKEGRAKIDDSTISALATNDPEDEVRVKEPKGKCRGRALKGKKDGADPDTTLLKDLRLPKKLTKKQNDQGLGRHRKPQ